MRITRRAALKSMTATSVLAASSSLCAPAIAQAKPCRLGILVPRTGIAASPGISGLKATEWAVERFNARRRHRGTHALSSWSRRRRRQRTPLSASRSSCSRTRSIAYTASSRPASPGPGSGGGGGARAHHLLGRHHPGRCRGEAAECPSYLFKQHGQRVRGGDVLAARHQALEGPVQAHRRHQPRLLLRPQQHGGLHRPTEAISTSNTRW